jgi:N-acetylneuraminate synthase
MASVAEISEAVTAARSAGARDIVVLKCTSTYPATPENSNLITIPNMGDTFGCAVGLSDHTHGCGVAVAAVALGACVIEKHFTLKRADGGVDSAFSMEPQEFRLMREECDRAWQAMGKISYGGTKEEENSRVFRRSLYITKNIKAGDILTTDNLRAVRPGYGLPPKFLVSFLGKRVARDLYAGERVDWSIFLPPN